MPRRFCLFLLHTCCWLSLICVTSGFPSLAQEGIEDGFEAGIEDEPPRVLFITQSKGFVHSTVKRANGERAIAELALMQLAKDSGEFSVEFTQDVKADFTKERLEEFDIVAFYTSGDLPISESEFMYFLNEWLPQKGHGVLGFHSATDTFKNFEPYWDLMGGTFAGHPWGAGSTVTMRVHDLEHPAMKPFGQATFEFQDEIYQYDHWQPKKVHVLMSLDMQGTAIKRPYHVPVAWCKKIGDGKLFYNNMGHREDTWRNQPFLDSILGAIRWIDGQVEGDARPNPKVSAEQHEKSIEAAKVSAPS